MGNCCLCYSAYYLALCPSMKSTAHLSIMTNNKKHSLITTIPAPLLMQSLEINVSVEWQKISICALPFRNTEAAERSYQTIRGQAPKGWKGAHVCVWLRLCVNTKHYCEGKVVFLWSVCPSCLQRNLHPPPSHQVRKTSEYSAPPPATFAHWPHSRLETQYLTTDKQLTHLFFLGNPMTCTNLWADCSHSMSPGCTTLHTHTTKLTWRLWHQKRLLSYCEDRKSVV